MIILQYARQEEDRGGGGEQRGGGAGQENQSQEEIIKEFKSTKILFSLSKPLVFYRYHYDFM